MYNPTAQAIADCTGDGVADGRSDLELLQAGAAGDLAALGELIDRHQRQLLSLAYRFTGRWDLAEDVVQETFLRVHRSAGHYRPRAKVSTWLCQIAVNLSLDARRRARRLPRPLGDQAPPPDPVERPDPIETRELADAVRQAVDALPDRQRTAVLLHRYQEFSTREIAETTGWSESAVESLLVRAYANLRQRLGALDRSG